MKKDAVQDERKRPINEDDFENPLDEMPVIDILEAEKEYNNNDEVTSGLYFLRRKFLYHKLPEIVRKLKGPGSHADRDLKAAPLAFPIILGMLFCTKIFAFFTPKFLFFFAPNFEV